MDEDNKERLLRIEDTLGNLIAKLYPKVLCKEDVEYLLEGLAYGWYAGKVKQR